MGKSSTPGSARRWGCPRKEADPMPSDLESELFVFVLATFVGFEVIRRVSPLLHTPLMSLTNAISAISLVGSIVITGAEKSQLSTIPGTIAVVGTRVHHEIVSYQWILVGSVLGAAIGVPLAVFMPMTHVPQRTALSHALGALAAALVGTAEYYLHTEELSAFTMAALSLEVILGCMTFQGSLMAFGKLQARRPSWPPVCRGS